MLNKQALLEQQKRLNALLEKDAPMLLQDVFRKTAPDVAEQLNLCLSEYSLLIQACLQDIEREERILLIER